ncbi:hypothetical protein [Nocardia gamkensis]|uniref:Uncharacterized protein n=1 Tax=Nocardia gamkensis TaxID=352869 RepID=A0A7X6L4Q6_9NOCA|nr:hypothetical protein [Nocardia gamkensis]NKY27765.1 hypothetical protein [Nocardia gamkensis]NQE67405.1 hypothetical protein [Nocardia gamkensis]
MNDVLNRLLRTKKLLAVVVLFVTGVGLMAVGKSLPAVRELGWLSWVPWSELGALLVGSGLLGVWLDAYFEREKQEADEARLRRLLIEQAPAMKEAVIKGFAFADDDLQRVATPELLDEIIANSLAMRLKDRELARELYTDIRDQAVQSIERWHDVKLSVRITTPRSDTADGSSTDLSGLVITVRQEYTTVPAGTVRRFVSVSDADEYRALTHDPASTFAWYYNPTSGIDAGAKEAFELVQFTVDGAERAIRRSARRGAQTYTVDLGLPDGHRTQPRTIAFTYRLQPAPQSRWLQFTVDQPSRGIDIDLDYSDTEIAYVNLIDFIASSHKTVVTKSPDTVPGRTIGLQFDGWIMPRSGVAFVWVKDDEVHRTGAGQDRAAA